MERSQVTVNQKHQPREMIKKGLNVSLPMMLAYFSISMTFGVLAKQAGISVTELTMMSTLVFAGASQFMGVNMIVVGASAVEIIIATFILNLRHFVMSLSFMNHLRNTDLKWRSLLSLLLTDETFAVSSSHTKEEKGQGVYFYITLFVSTYLSWIAGSFLGGLLGNLIPEKLSQSMGIALYAMFIGLLIPSVKKELKVGLIALLAMLVNGFFSSVLHLSEGWSIVLGTIIGGFSGIFLLNNKKEKN